MEITGEVVRVLETKETGENKYKSRSVHVKTIEQHPQILDIQFTQGNVTLLDNMKIGQKLKIAVNLKGREWTNKDGVLQVFNTIVGWKIEKLA